MRNLIGLYFLLKREIFKGAFSCLIAPESSFWKRESREGPIWRRFFFSVSALGFCLETGGVGVKKKSLTGGFVA